MRYWLSIIILLCACTVWGGMSAPRKPVTAAAAPSLTYVYSGGTATPTGNASQAGDYYVGSRFDDTGAITAKSLGFYLTSIASATACKAAIYVDVAETLITSCTISSPVGNSYNDCTISDTSLSASTLYHVFVVCNDGTVTVGTDGVSFGEYIAGTYANFPPSSRSGTGAYQSYITRIGY